ncbi:MAG: AMP-binding protein [Syntrophomonadales bacterium]
MYIPDELLARRPWLRHYDPVVKPSINYPSFPATEILRNTANVEGDKAATWFYGTEITYWDLHITVIRLANKLIELGVKKGDRVGIHLPNTPQFVIAYWALLTVGAIVVNLNPMYTKDELQFCVENTGVTALFTFDTVLPVIKGVLEEYSIPLVVVTRITDFVDAAPTSTREELGLPDGWHHFSELLEQSTNKIPPHIPIVPDDPAIIQFTGGTTGTPKGAVLTHRNVVAASFQCEMWGDSVIGRLPTSRKRVLCTLPFFHVYGEIVALCTSVQGASTMVILPRFDPDEVVNTIAAFPEYSFWPCVPTMLAAVLNHPRAEELELAKRFALINSGAAPCPVELIERANKLNIFFSEGWGMSETTSLGITQPIQGVKKPLSIGIPYPDTDVKLVDLNTGETVKQGEIGEIWIKSPLVMKEYWNNPEETAEQLKDGWLRTGDLAYMDEDHYIFIVDRSKDLIIAGGYNIYPRDIDEVLFKHPKVKDAITVGIPDEYRGETVKAFVQPVADVEVTAEELIAYCREHLAAYKVPRIIEFRSELPRSNVGKAFRRKLRDEEIAKMKKEKEEKA